jgi:GNAT superfamily N-acetyltransferase
MRVREATGADAAALAAVHVASWKATYAGLLPQGYLDSLDAGDRLTWWEWRLAEPVRRGSALLVAEDGSGAVLGFGALWPNEELPEGTVELPQLYLLPSAWGQGIGRALMAGLVDRAAALGFGEIVLWVHPGNQRARRFYELFGWTDSGVIRTEEVWGVQVPEAQYRLKVPRDSDGLPA